MREDRESGTNRPLPQPKGRVRSYRTGAKWERGSALNKADGAGKGKKSLQTGLAVADQQFPALF